MATVSPDTNDSRNRNKKRKNEEQPVVAKKSKSTRREEEKENVLKSLVPTPESSVAGSSRESSNPIGISRRKSRPKKISEIVQVVNTCEYEELLKNASENCETEEKIFLMRNIIQKKSLISKEAVCRKRTAPKIEPLIDRLLKNASDQNDLHDLCSLNFSTIRNWFGDENNYMTSNAVVQSYTLLVDDNDQVTMIENGFSTVLFTSGALSDVPESTAFLKRIKLTREEMDSMKAIYFGAVVKRKVPSQEKIGGKRRTARKTTVVVPEEQTFELGVRFGCVQMYCKGKKRSSLGDGLQKMILIDVEDKAEFRTIFGYMDEKGEQKEWMKDAQNLCTISQINNTSEDSLRTRLMFTSSTSPSNPDPNLSSESTSETVAKSSTKKINAHKNRINAIPAMLRDNNYKYTKLMLLRWPWFKIVEVNGARSMAPDPEYFKETTIDKYKNECLFRQRSSRCIQTKTKRNGVVSGRLNQSFSPRNRGVNGKRKFGLDFIQSPGHLPYIKYVYKSRISPLVPPFPNQTLNIGRNEVFPLNNAYMFQERRLVEEGYDQIPKSIREANEMIVVEVTPTQRKIDEFNEKLLNARVEKNRPPPKKAVFSKNQMPPPPNFPVDLDGEPIPCFSEIFFPYGKTEIYNLLQRYFFSEVGHRPGIFTAKWKSRVMAGFIKKHYEHIFENNLCQIFEKQLQVVALNSPDWKDEHYEFPIKPYRELKREWKRAKNSIPSTSSDSSNEPSTSEPSTSEA